VLLLPCQQSSHIAESEANLPHSDGLCDCDGDHMVCSSPFSCVRACQKLPESRGVDAEGESVHDARPIDILQSWAPGKLRVCDRMLNSFPLSARAKDQDVASFMFRGADRYMPTTHLHNDDT
jgi:hypothetical protein